MLALTEKARASVAPLAPGTPLPTMMPPLSRLPMNNWTLSMPEPMLAAGSNARPSTITSPFDRTEPSLGLPSDRLGAGPEGSRNSAGADAADPPAVIAGEHVELTV